MRPILIYANFSPRSHPIRPKLLRAFSGVATAAAKDDANLEAYYEAMTKSKFVLSPPGEVLILLSAANQERLECVMYSLYRANNPL